MSHQKKMNIEEIKLNYPEYIVGELNYNRSSWSYPDERNEEGISHHCIVGFTSFKEAEEVASEIEDAEIHAFCQRSGNHFFNDKGKVNKPFSISDILDILETKGNSAIAFTNDTIVEIIENMCKNKELEEILDYCKEVSEIFPLKENEVMIDGEIYLENKDIMEFYEDNKHYYIGVFVPYPEEEEEEEEEE